MPLMLRGMKGEASKTPVEMKHGKKEIWIRKMSLLLTHIEKVNGEIIPKTSS